MYRDEVIFKSRKDMSRCLSSKGELKELLALSSTWFVDCHDLLESSSADRILVQLLDLYREMPQSEHYPDGTKVPYILVIHSASVKKVVSAYPSLRNSTIETVIPPPRNKYNVLVNNINNVKDSLDYLYDQLMWRIKGYPSASYLNKTGDCLILTRSMDDAMLIHSHLNSAMSDYASRVSFKMIGPISATLGLLQDIKTWRFKSGVVLR